MLGETLRLLRVFHELKQGELANKLGVSNTYISEIEKGNKIPSMEVIQKYAEFFKVPVSSIMFFSEQLNDAKSKKNTSERAKTAISSKILNLLKWIEDRTESDAAH